MRTCFAKPASLVLILLGALSFAIGPAAVLAGDRTIGDHTAMKRRQQGILTGMPFMANIASRTFVDDTGRKLYLAKAPARVVSLAPSVTEMIFALGAADRLIAVTSFCDFPPEAADKPKIAGARAGVESLAALQADLIVTPRAFVDAALLDQLDRLKIPTFVLEAKSLEDVLGHLHTLGRMLDRVSAATQLVGSLRRRIQRVKDQTEALPRPRLLYVLNSQPLMTVGPGSFIHQLIELAGAENVGAATKQAYPRLSMEDVLKQNPDVLVFPVGASEGIPEREQAQWQRWTAMSAIRAQRIYQIDSVLMDRPGPRVVDGLERLAMLLHPEAFPASASSP